MSGRLSPTPAIKSESSRPTRGAPSDTDDDVPLARLLRGVFPVSRASRGQDALLEHLATCSIPIQAASSSSSSSSSKGEKTSRIIENSAQFEREIVRIVNRLHRVLGDAQNEMVYQRALELELERRGLAVQSEWEIPILLDGRRVGCRRADLVVRLPSGARYVLELKAVQSLRADHLRQLEFYMVHLRTRLGLLINFPRAQSYPDVEAADGAELDPVVSMLQGHATLTGNCNSGEPYGKRGRRDYKWRGRSGRVAPQPEIHRVKIARHKLKLPSTAGRK